MALSAARDTLSKLPLSVEQSFPVKGSTKIYNGSLVALNAGYLVPMSTATGLICVGRAIELADNSSGADGALKCKIHKGVHRWANGDSIAQADVGAIAYGVDDQTVSKDGTGKSVAGIIHEVDSSGAWVDSSISISGSLQ